MRVPFFLDQASTLAPRVDALYYGLVALTAIMMGIIFLPMFYFLYKYRRGNKADRRPIRIPTWKIEMTWTVIPLFIVIGFYCWGSSVYFEIERPPAKAMEINIIGKQWMWKLQHAEGNREINQLHVPVGETVRLTLTSQDVIHDFAVPAFRIKQDVLPGRYVVEWFKATKEGTYHIFCNEYCGVSHASMIGEVIVMSPAAYQDWLARGQPEETLVQSGERLFRELGCSGCHMGNSQIRAPRLEGVFGKPVPLQGGQFVVADEKYIRDSILLPQSQIVYGYAPLMPTYAGHVTEEELFQLIAYIKGLGNKQPEYMK
ncbi:MAG: cytochrome c oxidase subunit 2 [Pedosphaera sp.]|nr:cytochrome c oxidase subunit 2 [Pedosphaera sp.]